MDKSADSAIDDVSEISRAPNPKDKDKKKKSKNWKPPKMQSFETIRLCQTAKNPIIRPCGF